MEEGIPPTFNSPVIQKNTPIKRLGLSRKRKSCGSDAKLNTKIQKIKLDMENVMNSNETKEIFNYEKELQSLKDRIQEKEEKLKNLQWNQDKIENLEGLIELWKTGCKNAFLHFNRLLKEKQSEVNFKSVLINLGIWETLIENFENDSDICLSDYSQ